MEEKKEVRKITKQGLISSTYIFKYIRPYAGYFIAGLVLLVLGSLVFMVLPFASGEMANIATGKDKYNLKWNVGDFGWLFLVMLILQGVISYFRTIFFAIVSEKGMADLRKDLYNKIIGQRMIFFEERRVGELTSRVTADIEQLQSTFSLTLAEFIRQVVILISGVVIIAVLTPRLSLVMLATFPAIVISSVVFGRYIRKLSRERQDKLAETGTIVEETLQAFAVVKSFANEWYESIRYAKTIDDIVKLSLRFAKIRGLFFVFIITILFGGIFFILWQGALMVSKGTMPVGDLFSFIFYTGILGGAIASLGNLYTQLASSIAATERIQEILQSNPEIEVHPLAPTSLEEVKGSIVFENVHFSYPSRPEMQILKGLSFTVEEGSKVALVGQSGGGKSTIVQLLMRFYGFQQGGITIDGKDINDIDLQLLRRNIGYVPQEVTLFGGSIRENILYGNPSASEENLIDAASQSNSLEFINSFPEGFETIIGEKGIKLSGGQRQRIAIARAILKNPKILILDEATSSLDTESERIVQEALHNLMGNRTSIIIAHRLSTIKEVDKICVLHDGVIAESGDHDQLMAINGLYANLVNLQ